MKRRAAPRLAVFFLAMTIWMLIVGQWLAAAVEGVAFTLWASSALIERRLRRRGVAS